MRSLTRKGMSPPAGWKSLSFFTNIWLCEPHVREKEKTYHAAAGESGFRVWHAAGTVRTA